MLAYIKGKLVFKDNDQAIVEVGGIGYKVQMPSSSLAKLGKTGEAVQVFTHLQVREDVLNLYGFTSEEELDFFEILLQISGIGPKVAQAILSSFHISMIRQAIIEENIALLAKAPGVGKKTAQRIVLELKDKLSKLSLTKIEVASGIDIVETSNNSIVQDALNALEALGYSTHEATSVLIRAKNTIKDPVTIEDLIRIALKELSRN